MVVAATPVVFFATTIVEVGAVATNIDSVIVVVAVSTDFDAVTVGVAVSADFNTLNSCCCSCN